VNINKTPDLVFIGYGYLYFY